MKKKVEMWLPVFASARFIAEIDVPENETEFEIKGAVNEFFENMFTDGYLCHHCARELECDFEYDEEMSEDIIKEELERMIEDGELQ